ncbi:MAG: Gfo/Idh/MocA family oxidoreductase [Pseudomonadota bacterium]
MTDPIRIAILGAGYFARFHYDGWSRIIDVELVGCADHEQDKAKTLAEFFDVPETFETVEALLDSTKPDVLDIAVPPASHASAIRAAAERGVDVICQKPFCASLAEAEEMTQLAADAGITVTVHENFRFQPWYREIKRQLEQTAIGDVYSAMFDLRPGDGQGADAYLERQPYFRKMPRFLMRETAIHFIDTFRFLFGDVADVYADLRRLNPAIAGEDAGTFVLNFKSGVQAVFDGNRLVDHAAQNHRLTMGEMRIEGSKGVIALSGDARLTRRAKGSPIATPINYVWRDTAFGGDCVYALQEAFTKARLAGTRFANTAEDYLENLRIEDAIYSSAAEHRRIDLA